MLDNSQNPLQQALSRASATLQQSRGSGTWGSQGIIPQAMNLFGMGTGAPGINANGSIQGAAGPTSVGGAPLQQPDQTPAAGSGTWGSRGIIPQAMNLFGMGTGAPGTNANGSIQGAYGPTSVGGAPLHQAPQQDQGGLIQRMLGYLGNKASI